MADRSVSPECGVELSDLEWRVLTDGDEIVVGRYRLHFVESAPAISASESSPLETTG